MSKMKTTIVSMTMVAMLAVAAGGAFAQNLSTAQLQALRSACASDVRAVCPGVQPGGGRILACVQANADKISQPCKDAIASAKPAN